MARRIPCSAGERVLFSGLSLTLQAGERVALYAPSGGGKTCLLRCLVALDPLDEGQLLLDGDLIGPGDGAKLRSRVAYVAQSPRVRGHRVRDYLMEPWSYSIRAQSQGDDGRLVDLLCRLDLDKSLVDGGTESLSGGERKRLALARALWLEPRALLLDEPTAGLDDKRLLEMWQLIDDFCASGGAALVASHGPQRGFSPLRAVRLESGRLTDDGSTGGPW